LNQIVYPSGRTITTTYDAAARVSTVKGVSLSYASGLQYAAHGGVAQATLGNNLTEQTCYNDRLQPLAIRLGTGATVSCAPAASDPFYIGYGYNTATNNGNLASQTVVAPMQASQGGGLLTMAQAYTYDGVNRLWTAGETVTGAPTGTAPGNWSSTFGYDQYGNQWTTTTLPPTPGTPSGQPQFTAASNRLALMPDGLTALPSDAYDAGGNLQDYSLMGQMKYDGENRLVQMTGTGNQTTYDYDGEGRRVRKTANGAVTLYVYDAGGQLTAEYGASDPATGTQYYTADHLGSTRAITNAAGQVTTRMDYQPFGGLLAGSVEGNRNLVAGYNGDPYLSFEFTGKERDAESGLDYFGARYISSAQGRFTSPDPKMFPHDITDPQSWNKYSYTRNNPLRYTDPDGEDWGEFLSGVADTTYRPFVQAASHPLNTLAGLGIAISHPIDTAIAIKNGVVDTTEAALSGDSTALGQVTGTILSTVLTAGAAKAGSALLEGAEAADAATTAAVNAADAA
jgi:RHS repeat-associated protein